MNNRVLEYQNILSHKKGYYIAGQKIELSEFEILEFNKFRFWSKVAITANPNNCWIWKGAKSSGGYGCFGYNGKIYTASRLAYQFHYGDYDQSLLVCHKCDVRHCCNPNHLFLGTNVDNMQDMLKKGRNKAYLGESNFKSKIKNENVFEMISLRQSGLSYPEIGKRYGISPEQVSNICRRKNWKHI